MQRALFVFIFFLVANFSFSQETNKNQPKLAIVLSGGGAKGIAHIPLLKLLDSLNVKPDLIVGTSMGSVVGGLYAMGYSADSIEYIAKNMDWDRLLSNDIDFNHINPSERSEDSNYLVKLPFENGKLNLPSGLIESQELSLFFNRSALAVQEYDYFDLFPIAFRSVSADIVTGDKIVMAEGDVIAGIRSSMAIPTIFTPVFYRDQILVDGGVLDNFPVDVAQEWGADIIIGSDVSGGFVKSGKSSSFFQVMIQSSVITSAINNKINRGNCDILIDHVPNLTHGTSDFAEANEILSEGKMAVDQNVSQIIEATKPFVVSNWRPKELDWDIIKYDKLEFEGIKPHHVDLLKNRLKLKDSDEISTLQFEEKMRIGYGSDLFEKLTYRVYKENDIKVLKISGQEKPKSYLKSAIHYDTEQGAGIIFNLMTRDFLGKNSRTLATVDASETPKVRIQHQQYILDKKWWYRTEYAFESLNRSDYTEGVANGDFTLRYNKATFQLLRDIGNNNSFSMGVGYFSDVLIPDIEARTIGLSPDSLVIERDGFLLLDNFSNRVFLTSVGFQHNSQLTRFYPKRGMNLNLSVQYVFDNKITFDFWTNVLEPISNYLDHAWISNFNYFQSLQVSDKLSIQPVISAGIQYSSSDEYFSSGFLRFNFLGGIQRRLNPQIINFPGLREGELVAAQFVNIRLQFQYELLKNMYLIPSVQYSMLSQRPLKEFMSDLENGNISGNWTDLDSFSSAYVYSGSLQLGYNTPIGPINFMISKPNDIKGLRYYFSLGFIFF